jgi:hypothetical protein
MEHNTTTRYNISTTINRISNKPFQNVVHIQVKFNQGRLPPLTYNKIYVDTEEVPTGKGKHILFQNLAHDLVAHKYGRLSPLEHAKIWVGKPPETTEHPKINHALLPVSSPFPHYLRTWWGVRCFHSRFICCVHNASRVDWGVQASISSDHVQKSQR